MVRRLELHRTTCRDDLHRQWHLSIAGCQLPDGTYTGNIPQGTDTSHWNNVVYPRGYPYGFSGGTMNNPMYYYNAITGAYGSLGGGEGGK